MCIVLIQTCSSGRRLRYEQIFLGIAGLTGPFSILLLPLFTLHAYIRKNKSYIIVIGITAVIQGTAVLTGRGSSMLGILQGHGMLDLVQCFCSFWCEAMLGVYISKPIISIPVAAIAVTGVILFWVILNLIEYRKDWVLTVLMYTGTIILGTGILLVYQDKTELSIFHGQSRYYFTPLVCLAAWCGYKIATGKQKFTAYTILALLMLSNLSRFNVRSRIMPWKEHCQALREHRYVSIPIANYQGNMEYNKQPKN